MSVLTFGFRSLSLKGKPLFFVKIVKPSAVHATPNSCRKSFAGKAFSKKTHARSGAAHTWVAGAFRAIRFNGGNAMISAFFFTTFIYQAWCSNEPVDSAAMKADIRQALYETRLEDSQRFALIEAQRHQARETALNQYGRLHTYGPSQATPEVPAQPNP
jgi:hypothetical protein